MKNDEIWISELEKYRTRQTTQKQFAENISNQTDKYVSPSKVGKVVRDNGYYHTIDKFGGKIRCVYYLGHAK